MGNNCLCQYMSLVSALEISHFSEQINNVHKDCCSVMIEFNPSVTHLCIRTSIWYSKPALISLTMNIMFSLEPMRGPVNVVEAMFATIYNTSFVLHHAAFTPNLIRSPDLIYIHSPLLPLLNRSPPTIGRSGCDRPFMGLGWSHENIRGHDPGESFCSVCGSANTISFTASPPRQCQWDGRR